MRSHSPSLAARCLLTFGALSLAALGGRQAPAEEPWKPTPAPLLTHWAADVRPDRARPEYPRPQFERKDWKSLNGLWQFAFDDRNEGRAAGWSSGKRLPQRIL